MKIFNVSNHIQSKSKWKLRNTMLICKYGSSHFRWDTKLNVSLQDFFVKPADIFFLLQVLPERANVCHRPSKV